MEKNVLLNGATRLDEVRVFAWMGGPISNRSFTDGGMDYLKGPFAAIQTVSHN